MPSLGRKFNTHDLVALGAKAAVHQLNPLGRKAVKTVTSAMKIPAPPVSELEK